jgi:hypothetical protein
MRPQILTEPPPFTESTPEFAGKRGRRRRRRPYRWARRLMHTDESNRRYWGRVAGGVLVMLFGLALAARSGGLDSTVSELFWPATVIALALTHLVPRPDSCLRRSWPLGCVLAAVGVWGFWHATRAAALDWATVSAMLIVTAGEALLVETVLERRALRRMTGKQGIHAA